MTCRVLPLRHRAPQLESLACAYWRACQAASNPDAMAQNQALIAFTDLANHPRMLPLVKGKILTSWIGDDPTPKGAA